MNRQKNFSRLISKNILVVQVVIITVILTGLVIGGGVYYWQKTKYENEKDKLQMQIQKLQEQVSSLENRIEEQPYLLFDRMEEQNQVVNLREHVGVFYKGEENASYPVVSPNKKSIAYIAPFEWEVLGEVYIYDSDTDSSEVVIKRNDLPKQYTPKVVFWLDDRYLLVIIGYAYGTVTVGGNLYIFDTITKRLNLYIKCKERQEIKNIFKNNDEIIFEIVNFNKEATEYTTEQESIKYKEVLLKAKAVK